MEKEEQIELKPLSNDYEKNQKKYERKTNIKYLYYLIPIILFILIIINFVYFSYSNKDSSKNNLNTNTYNEYGVRVIDDNHLFDYYHLDKIRKEQNEFCDNPTKYNISQYEEQITIANVSLLSQIFKMYVYKKDDIVSSEILIMENWESDKTNDLLTALLYYSSINNLNPQDIYALDIGSKIGWYSLVIAKFGYNILSFEPGELNNFILKKNYCLNRELNITFINKGLYNDERKCNYYVSKGNRGDGWIFCNKNENLPQHLIKEGETTLTKLSHYIPFLIKHNLALIKNDAEGCEEMALEGGIQLISKYHIPFIYLEFNPESLQQHGTAPRKFLKMFIKNGYLFASYNFFDDVFLSIDEIMGKVNGTMNLYIVNRRVSRKYHKS